MSERKNILDVLRSLTGLPVFYATDPASFWLAAEDCESYPAVGIYEAQGAETLDTLGVIHPRVELHVLTVGGSFDERVAPSEDVADGRATLSELLRRLRPYVLRIPQQCGFSRKDSLYSNWASLELRDPLTPCRETLRLNSI